ncbi:hypothetical protein [uncultured Ruminococcus sp.]|uniref:hypothetical protein n=1 Tax=uncultured Ruminococcus sp. TaxID=165186 RepID=UPI0025D79D80|nr:hypothetical protein [uncultured Ruminococcus sp.]
MRSIHIGLTAAVTAASLFLSGCTGMSFTVDGLLNAPKLTEEQGEIHEALTAAVGGSITLKYPRNGDNRSAFVIADLDGEQGEEALVFYEYNTGGGSDEGIRVNLLDKDDEGRWYSVKELAGAGTEVDRVIISQMGEKNRYCVLVGYQPVTGSDCTLEIYSCYNGEFKRIGTDTYSVLDTLDINYDGYREIVTIQQQTNAETGVISAKASLLDMSADNELVKTEGIDMCDNVQYYVNTCSGLLNKQHEAIFIDGLDQDGNLQTEIVYYRYSTLQNPMQLSPQKLLPLCTRPTGYYSTDVDGDGIVEIPSAKPMTGYENAIIDEMIYMTTWNVYEDFFDLKEKFHGYYSISNGYFFAFPNRWNDEVTVKREADNSELVFYKYNGDINDSKTEIMRIAAVSRKESRSYVDDGYRLIANKGQLDYYVKLPADKREQLILTIDEVKNNFYIVD